MAGRWRGAGGRLYWATVHFAAIEVVVDVAARGCLKRSAADFRQSVTLPRKENAAPDVAVAHARAAGLFATLAKQCALPADALSVFMRGFDAAYPDLRARERAAGR